MEKKKYTRSLDQKNMTQEFYVQVSYRVRIISIDTYFQTEKAQRSSPKSALQGAGQGWRREVTVL